MERILIAYCTQTGTTREIAGEIEPILHERGYKVDILPIAENPDPAPYALVIVGAPIHGMSWDPAATAWVTGKAAALSGTKVAFFYVSYLMQCGRPFWQKAIAKSLDAVSKTVPPLSVGRFPGRLQAPMPAFANWIFGVRKGTPLDLRNHNTVRQWAHDLLSLL
jgi:menaquinone-dependent protoporphyrinogen oxidase